MDQIFILETIIEKSKKKKKNYRKKRNFKMHLRIWRRHMIVWTEMPCGKY